MADPESLLRKAQKAAASASSSWNPFSSSSDRWEAAADLYIQAASEYNGRSQMREAAQAYEKAAEIQSTKVEDRNYAAYDDAAQCYQSAANANREPEGGITNLQDATRCHSILMSSWTQPKDANRKATLLANKMAPLYDKFDRKKAEESYFMAGKLHEDARSPNLAVKNYKAAARSAAFRQDYATALDIFSKAAQIELDNTRHQLTNTFFCAGLCRLALKDNVTTARAFEEYRSQHVGYANSNEDKLLTNIFEAVRAGDKGLFEDVYVGWVNFRPAPILPDQVENYRWQDQAAKEIENGIVEQGEDFS